MRLLVKITVLIIGGMSVLHALNSKAIKFNDGDSSYIDVGSDLKPTEALTLEFWGRVDEWKSGINQKFISCTQGGGYQFTTISTDSIRFYVSVDDYYERISYSAAGLGNDWHHYAGVYESGRYLKLYIDGSLVATEDIGSYRNPIDYGTLTNSTLLGAEAGSGSVATGEYLNGAIDEVRFWSDARTTDEIARCREIEMTPYADNLMAYYKLETAAGSIVEDASLNSHSGSIKKSAWPGTEFIYTDHIKALKPYSTGSVEVYISNKDELYWLSHCPDAWTLRVQILRDIYFDSADFQSGGLFYNEGQGFLPIGTYYNPFSGTLNGNEHIIDGMVILANFQRLGFLGKTNGASVNDLGITNANITPVSLKSYIGALAGCIYNSIIEECFSTTADGESIDGDRYIGGLVGYASKSSILNCYSTADVSGRCDPAGLCEYCDESDIANSYSSGTIICDSDTNNCFVGKEVAPTNYHNNFFDMGGSGQSSSIGATGKSSGQMGTLSTYIDTDTDGLTEAWDFVGLLLDDVGSNDIWDMDQDQVINNGYPILRWQAGADDLPFAADFSGEGIWSSPFLIESLEDLRILSENDLYWKSDLRQTVDIDAAATSGWNEGAGFSPIGNNSTPFQGNYDGGEQSINHLTINRPDENYVGLFGKTSGESYIRYLHIADAHVNGGSRVGALVGSFQSADNTGNILYTAVEGEVTGRDSCGLFAGELRLAPDYIPGTSSFQIHHCHSLGTVTRAESSTGSVFGGFCGSNDLNITLCYAAVGLYESESTFWSSGDRGFVGMDSDGVYGVVYFDTDVSGQSSDAGAVGLNSSAMKNIDTFINAGWLTIRTLVQYQNFYTTSLGINRQQNDGYPFMLFQYTDENSYSKTTGVSDVLYYTATVNAEIYYKGTGDILSHGICWSETPIPSLSDNKNDLGSTATAGEFSMELSGLSPATRYYVRSYIITEYDTMLCPSSSYFQTKTAPVFEGQGTESDPLRIGDRTDLKTLAQNSDYRDDHFILTADIDAYDADDVAVSSIEDFTGSFNGNNHTISNLRACLFSSTSGARIENLGLINVSVMKDNYAGALVGNCDYTIVKNCYSTGVVRGSGDSEGEGSYIGGLFGYISFSTVENCYSTARISSSLGWWETYYTVDGPKDKYISSMGDKIGGLAGSSSHTTIDRCYSSGNVSGKDYVGTFAGDCSNSSIIRNCYSKGTVSGEDYTASFIGSSDESSIINCYSIGSCTSNSYPDPAFIGSSVNSSVSNNFYDSETSGQSTATGAVAKTTNEMKQAVTFTSLTGGDLDSVWDFRGVSCDDSSAGGIWDIQASVNDGYPFLMCEYEEDDYICPDDGTSLCLYIPGASARAVVQYNNQTPVAGVMPEGINTTAGFSWNITAPSGGWTMATISIPLCEIPGNIDSASVSWLKREASDEVWTDIGGTVINGVLISDPFTSFSEFTVGSESEDQSLPVELSTFTARQICNGVTLHWETESEIENLGFILE